MSGWGEDEGHWDRDYDADPVNEAGWDIYEPEEVMATQQVERIKLASAGTSLHMIVQTAELVPVGRYPEYSFIGQIDNGRVVDLRVPQRSADRQLGRLELTLADVPGKRLRFARGENATDPSKPFWDIDVINDSGAGAAKQNGAAGASSGAAAGVGHPAGSSTGTKTLDAPATSPAPAPKYVKTGAALYREITEWTLKELVPLYERAGKPLTGDGIVACVATQFIQASRH